MAGVVTRVVFVGASKKPSFVTETCPLPSAAELQDGEVLLRMRMATICAGDLETLDGRCCKPIPSVMGHEGVAEVLLSKRRDLDLNFRDRVVFSSTTRCEICATCRRNLSIQCPAGIQYGHGPLNASCLSGTFASHLILRKGTHIIKVPPTVDDGIASTVNCPLVTMVNAVEVIKTKLAGGNDRKVAVLQGINLFSIYGCLLLKEAGFSDVYMTDPSLEQQKLAAMFGGIASFDKKDGKRRSCLPPSCTVDVVVQTASQMELAPEGTDLLRPGGLYLMVGVGRHVNTSANVVLNSDQIIKKCLTVQGVYGHQKFHLNAAMDFLQRIGSLYPLKELISPPYPLHDLPIAVRTARSGLYSRVAVTLEHLTCSS